MAAFRHLPVLAKQALAALKPGPGGLYIDGTLGGGGHAALLLEASSPDGRLLGIDRDCEALAAAGERLRPYGSRFCAVQGNFAAMRSLAAEAGFDQADGILLDIGVSSYQLDQAERGFSYMQDAPLDMRMDQSAGLTAADLLNTLSEAELKHILYTYGEERWAARIAKFIAAARDKQPFATTGQLAAVIKQAMPAAAREKDQHPAKRSFQALRIAVNGELEALEQGIEAAISLLKPGGRLAVISFHSLEDRIVKEKFRYHASGCVCPPGLPACVCGHQASIRLANRKPILPSAEELAANPRSRSARLRAAIKL